MGVTRSVVLTEANDEDDNPLLRNRQRNHASLPKVQQLTALRARLESEYQTTNHLRFYSMAYLPSYFFL